jgi:hypothetical protein
MASQRVDEHHFAHARLPTPACVPSELVDARQLRMKADSIAVSSDASDRRSAEVGRLWCRSSAATAFVPRKRHPICHAQLPCF